MKKPALPSLTGIRGIAAIWIVAFHLVIFPTRELSPISWLEQSTLIRRGWSGVDLFFILSGFVLMYAHGAQFNKLSSRAVSEFFTLRLLRVYPVNWAVLLLIGLLATINQSYWHTLVLWSVGNRPAEAFLRTASLGTRWLPGLGDWNEPTWSLSVEMIGYSVFPLLALGLNRLRDFRALALIAVAALCAMTAYQVLTDTVTANDRGIIGGIVRMASCFVAGTSLARARDAVPHWIKRRAASISVAFLAVVIASGCWWRAAFTSPFAFSGLIFILSLEAGWISAFLKTKPALFLGKVSFPLYLIHGQTLVWLTANFDMHDKGLLFGILVSASYFAVTIWCSWLLHVYVEQPFHQLGRTLCRRSSDPVTSSASQSHQEEAASLSVGLGPVST